DHKLKCGNSLVGCWLHRFEDYPVLAWARDGGDKQHDGVHFQKGQRSKRIKEIFQNQVVPELVKTLMAKALTGNWAVKSLESLRERFAAMHQIQRNEAEREEFYRREILGSEEYRQLRAAMDRWCAVWFWPVDGSVEQLTPVQFEAPTLSVESTVTRLREQFQFFHWELEFPEVFSTGAPGFNAILGNPPWDIQKPNSLEFFAQFDPIYRTYGKQEALQQQRRIFNDHKEAEIQWLEYLSRFRSLSNWVANVAAPFDVQLSRQAYAEQLLDHWRNVRRQRIRQLDESVPFRNQGGADLNTYKLFVEQSWFLNAFRGRLGLLVPSGIYSDKGSGGLRRLLLRGGTWELLVAIVNERFIFEGVDHRFRFCALVAERGKTSRSLQALFRITVENAPRTEEVDQLLQHSNFDSLPIDLEWLERYSGDDLLIPAFRTPVDKLLLEKLSAGRRTFAQEVRQYASASFATEFHMTGDSKHFLRRSEVERRGVLREGDDVRDPRVRASLLVQGLLPLLEGKSINQFTPYYSDSSRYFIPLALKRLPNWNQVLWREVASATNSRTVIAAHSTATCHNHKLWAISGLPKVFARRVVAILNSLVFDWLVRLQLGATTVGLYTISPVAVPPLASPSEVWSSVDTWLLEMESGVSTGRRRLELRCMIDAVIGWLYGLSPDEFRHIACPEAFPALDRRLPAGVRYQDLVQSAFRRLHLQGVHQFCTTGWTVDAEEFSRRRDEQPWSPPGGWEQAWADARATLNDEQWAMLTGEYEGIPTEALREVAAAKEEPAKSKKDCKPKNQLRFDMN
ncbi:MAG TPA: hypothetical protein VNT01_13510, partial [Symbiobacteriaceae bacterium]|nr:hypothetical protein [Symbiobacteriaceae bacterium]